MRKERDLAYARAGQQDLQVNLYLPEKPSAGQLPAIVWVHGGAWGASAGGHRVALLGASGGLSERRS